MAEIIDSLVMSQPGWGTSSSHKHPIDEQSTNVTRKRLGPDILKIWFHHYRWWQTSVCYLFCGTLKWAHETVKIKETFWVETLWIQWSANSIYRKWKWLLNFWLKIFMVDFKQSIKGYFNSYAEVVLDPQNPNRNSRAAVNRSCFTADR